MLFSSFNNGGSVLRMANYPGLVSPIETIDGFIETEQTQYIQVEEQAGTTPITTLQAEMLDPLARELARIVRDLIASGELSVSETGEVCGKIGENI